MEPDFAEFSGRDRIANERHFRACEAEGRPVMIIKVGRKYATLEWDCITLAQTNERHIRGQRGDLLMRGMYDRFCAVAKLDPGRPEFFGSAFCGTITGLLPDTARKLAQEYFHLLRVGGEAHTASTL